MASAPGGSTSTARPTAARSGTRASRAVFSVSPNAWEGVYGLITRADPTGQFPGTLWPEQAITRDEAIAVYTTGAAEAMGLAQVCGALVPGRSADFVLLDADPFAVELDALPALQTLETWFAGEQVFSRS